VRDRAFENRCTSVLGQTTQSKGDLKLRPCSKAELTRSLHRLSNSALSLVFACNSTAMSTSPRR
jgi:hypothetical protein